MAEDEGSSSDPLEGLDKKGIAEKYRGDQEEAPDEGEHEPVEAEQVVEPVVEEEDEFGHPLRWPPQSPPGADVHFISNLPVGQSKLDRFFGGIPGETEEKTWAIANRLRWRQERRFPTVGDLQQVEERIVRTIEQMGSTENERRDPTLADATVIGVLLVAGLGMVGAADLVAPWYWAFYGSLFFLLGIGHLVYFWR